LSPIPLRRSHRKHSGTTECVADHLLAATPYRGSINFVTRNLDFDEENRLRSAVGSGNTVAYEYDPLGRRRSKTVNGAVTRFVSDGAEERGFAQPKAGSSSERYSRKQLI
jgi:YD repeat-containing protein